jgi:hypothetical protein
VVSLALTAGCGAAPRPDQPSAPPVTTAVPVPADGLTLAQLGFRNGPATAFSVPRVAVISTRVDQPSGVTVVFSSPAPGQLAGYLRRSLPASGWVVTADDPAASSLTFSGYGWQGSFTGTGGASAVILRP